MGDGIYDENVHFKTIMFMTKDNTVMIRKEYPWVEKRGIRKKVLKVNGKVLLRD